MNKILIFIFSLVISFSIFSAEVDQYTKREEPLADSLIELNSRANDHLSIAIDRANLTGACSTGMSSQLKLYTELKKEFANHSKGQLTIDLLVDKSISIHKIALSESVYGAWKIRNGFLLGRKKAATSPLAIFPLINMNGYHIGIDKLEHMFGMGFIYFERHHLKGRKLKGVLKHGILREKTVLGGLVLATGVFAYADLAANFNGMRFWNHMLQLEDDVLGKSYNRGPYIKCDKGSWKAHNKIDFSHYIDDSMDESLNCSKFANRNGVKKFTRAMKKLNSEYTCPMSKEKLEAMKDKYDIQISKKTSISDWIINMNGNEELSLFNEF
jgi:hypothetical protein